MTEQREGGIPPQPRTSVDPDLELKGLLGQFTLTFLKGLMSTGIYPPDHPAVREVVDEPYLLLKRLAPSANEITFMSASAAIGDEIMVEGVLSEGIPFTTLLHSSMGEIFARKFVAYFERNQLVSFSIKTRVGRDELQKLISVFAEYRSRDEDGSRQVLDFGEMLLKKGIVHVTAMSRSEIVGGERPLPWRVKMAISRLRKDLRNVPLYSEATAQELAEVKRLLVQDITRPLRRPQFLKELLANTDLITEGVEELRDVDMQFDIISGLHPGMLVNISWDIVGDLERAAWGAIRQQVGGIERRLDAIFKDILKLTAVQLREWEPETVKGLMHHLFQKKILQYKELPATLQQEMLLDKWTKQFMSSKEQILQRFATLTDDKLYTEYLDTFLKVFPELVRRGHLQECKRLAALLADHATTAVPAHPERQARARAAQEGCATEANVKALLRHAGDENRETRTLAIQCLRGLGENAVSPMLELLGTSRSSSVRRDLVGAIEEAGEDAHVPLMELLAGKGHEWYLYRNGLLLVGKTRCFAALDDVRKFLSHPHPRVREEAVQVLSLLRGPEAGADLMPLLEDSDAAVVRKVIAVLVRFDFRLPPFLKALVDIIRPRTEKEMQVPPTIQLAALEAIRRLRIVREGKTDVREVLFQRLGRDKSVLRKLLKRGGDPEDDQVRVSVLDTLAAIGDASLLKRLQPILQDPSAEVRARAAETIRALRAKPS
jgi:HEAT repeat protein/predicted transcriptional regulator